MRYNLITLNASEMMSRYETTKFENNWKIEYKYMIGTVSDSQYGENAFLDQMVVSSVEPCEDCAMFHQLRRCIEKRSEGTDNAVQEWNESSLQQAIIYVDFKDVFMGSEEIKKGNVSHVGLTEEELKCNIASADVKLRWMLDPENGITLLFPDGKNSVRKINFVPFDKSSSMARDCKMTFVDKRLKGDMDTRLQLGIDFEKISLSQSKYYAYRGLYLTTAQRIEKNDSFRLNAETVIVMNDDMHDIKFGPNDGPVKVFGEIPKETENEPGAKDKKQEEMCMTFGEQEIEKYPNVNAFDGEGIISPSYTDAINEQLENIISKKASSFQIRMPFAKGMLHRVDFNAFFSEILNEKLSDNAPLMVKDAFGRERDLRKAQIIMTKSMFKCFKWLSSHWNMLSDDDRKKYADDPMCYYFHMIEKYDHSLYVANTDAVLHNNGRTKLNYQYISTLDMSAKDLRKIAGEHIDRVLNSDAELIEVQTDADNESDGSHKKNDRSVSNKWKEALKKNRALINDRHIDKEICAMKEEGLLDAGIGRISVAGECRFLSGDLLSFLCFISSNLTDKGYRSCFDAVKKETMYRDKFYAAKDTIDYFDKKRKFKYFGLLRNPHLSRNEQCALRPYSSRYYEDYFSHLTGVIMVPRKSLVPMILAGADFDGDLVKVIGDNTVVNAILKGAYRKIDEEKGRYERKLAVVQIPSLPPKETKGTGSIPYDVIFDTFASQVGHISNMALKVSRTEYGCAESEKKDAFLNKCAECTIITGLEIDAAKTGVHPTANIKKIESLLRKNKMYGNDYFVDLKNKMEGVSKLWAGVRSFGIKPFSEQSDHAMYYLKGNNNPYMSIKRIPTGDEDHARVDSLPQFFAEAANTLAPKKKGKEEKAEITKAPEIATVPDSVFVFGGENGWRDKLDKTTLNKTIGLIRAYYKILDVGAQLYKARENYKNTKLLGCIVNTLTKQYGGVRTVILTTAEEGRAITAETALSNAYSYLEEVITDEKAGTKVLKKLIVDEWQYTAREDRLQKLREILSVAENKGEEQVEDIPADVARLLTNFSHGGYKLLYYMVKDVICHYKERNSADLIIERQNIRITNSSKKSEESGDNSYNAYKNIYTGELYKSFMESARAKESKSIWNPKIVKLCRKKLNKIFGYNMNEALKYVFAAREMADKNSTFFWNVFDLKVILDNIVECPTREADESAEEAVKKEGAEIA